MKPKIPLATAAAIIGLSAMCGAFTLDAVGYEGGELSPNPYSVLVPGYGELIFETAVGTPVVISSGYGNTSETELPVVRFDEEDAIRITFNGLAITNVNFYFAGLSFNEGFEVRNLTKSDLFTPQAFLITLKGSGDGADLHAITWNTQSVPEPSSALLGMMGAAGMMLRRKR